MKKLIISIFISVFLFLPYNCLAKSVTCINGTYEAEINIEKEKMGIGDSTTLTINSDYEYEIDYKVNDKGIIEITEGGLITALKEGETSINAKITFTEDNEELGECYANISFAVVSNDSSLKSLNLEEIDISALFQPDKYEYEFKIPYKFEKINIIAEANNSGAKITGDGRRYLNEGVNDYEIVVTATDGNTTTYKIKFIRESANDDITLKNLNVEGYILTPEFNKEIYEYSLNIDKEIEEITINAEPTYEFAKIRGNGTHSLASGKNELSVIVTAENGNEAEYKIIINKNNGSSKLKSLVVDGYKLDPKFDEETFIYNLTVNSDIDTLTINALAYENDQVEIMGNEKLELGENEIIIRVTGEDKTTTTYKIIVNKLSLEEEQEIEKNNTLLKVLFIMFIISIVIMTVVIGIFIKKNYKKKRKIKSVNKRKNKKNKKK